ncbi:hypothetical protein [Flavobacterium sp. ZB4R12]
MSKSIQIHYEPILNYFDNRSTNASAGSFNTKKIRANLKVSEILNSSCLG